MKQLKRSDHMSRMNNLISMLLIFLGLMGMVMQSTAQVAANHENGNAENCQDSDHAGWTKIDSEDLDDTPPYNVPGATQYCYKAGQQRLYSDTALPWDYNDEGEIIVEGMTKGLSHWSYFIPSQSSPSPSPSTRPSPEVSPEPSPTVRPTPTPGSPRPSASVSPSPSPSVSPTPSPSPTPTSTPSTDNDDDDDNGTGGSSSQPSSEGQVLGATTDYAPTGVFTDILMSIMGLTGAGLTSAGTYLYGKKN